MILILLVVFSVAPGSLAQNIEPIIHIGAANAGGEFVAITSSGDIFYWTQHYNEWQAHGNIPDLAGRPATAPFVGTSYLYTSTINCDFNNISALTSDGDVYVWRSVNGWEFFGNISESSGRPALGEFVSLTNSLFACAITDLGEAYALDGLGAWQFLDSIPADTGVVTTNPESMGDVKSMFR